MGLRLFVLLFDHKGRFPTLTSGLWQRVMTSNDLRGSESRESTTAGQLRSSCGSALCIQYGNTGKDLEVLGNNINGTKWTLQDWVANHPTSVTMKPLMRRL